MAISCYPTCNAQNPYGISVIYIEQIVQWDDKQYIAKWPVDLWKNSQNQGNWFKMIGEKWHTKNVHFLQ